jgi:cytochrome c oxidase subunit 2
VEKIPSSILTLLAGIVLTLFGFWVAQSDDLLPAAASSDAAGVDQLFKLMLGIGGALFLLITGLLVISLLRFRAQPGDSSEAEPVRGNLSLEALWTGVTAVVIFGLGIYSFSVYTDMGGLSIGHGDHGSHMAMASGSAMAAELPSTDATATEATRANESKLRLSGGVGGLNPQQPADVTVEVKGLQFAWIFTYPDSGIVSGELHLPVNQDVELNITAQDVIHAFWVPQFRLKQDAIPGEATELRFKPTQTGRYPIVCAELCGSYHGAMRTEAVVETPEEYEAWRQQQLAALQAEATPTSTHLPALLSQAAKSLDLEVTPSALEALQPPHVHHHTQSAVES